MDTPKESGKSGVESESSGEPSEARPMLLRVFRTLMFLLLLRTAAETLKKVNDDLR